MAVFISLARNILKVHQPPFCLRQPDEVNKRTCRGLSGCMLPLVEVVGELGVSETAIERSDGQIEGRIEAVTAFGAVAGEG